MSNTSRSFNALEANLSDHGLLIAYHNAGERRGIASDVTLRAAVVFLITSWEAYIEDITTESLNTIINRLSDPSLLPNHLKKTISTEIKKDHHEHAAWKLAGGAWRQFLSDRWIEMTTKRNRSFNSPTPLEVDELLDQTLGVQNIREKWGTQACTSLKSLVELRGCIVHRGKLPSTISVSNVETWIILIRSLALDVDIAVRRHLLKLTGSDFGDVEFKLPIDEL